MEDDSVNAFLGFAITGWSFPSPIPAQANMAAADKVIGRAMSGKDWSSLRRQVKPLMDELEGRRQRGPKSAAHELAKLFLWQYQKRDPKLAPKPPRGFPAEMMLYRRFAKAYNWTPSQVRGLRLDELFWLPVIADAEAEAAETIQALQDK